MIFNPLCFMHDDIFSDFSAARKDFLKAVVIWNNQLPDLANIINNLNKNIGKHDYTVETPIVYNSKLDELILTSKPQWILIADNPGKTEQKASVNYYLAGHAGKLAAGFFQKKFGFDFYKDIVIINKTPIHTCNTSALTKLITMDSKSNLAEIFKETQKYMARFAYKLYKIFGLPVWISGKSGLSENGIFSVWFKEFRELFIKEDAIKNVYVYNHFSMNSFSLEMSKKVNPEKPFENELLRIGRENRLNIFGV